MAFTVLTGEQEEIRQLVRTLARESLAPRAAETDESHAFPWDVAHMTLVPRIIELMRARDAEVPILIGGTIPDDDIVSLKALGVAEVFTPGAPTSRIVELVHDVVAA